MNWRTASSVCGDVGLFATLLLEARDVAKPEDDEGVVVVLPDWDPEPDPVVEPPLDMGMSMPDVVAEEKKLLADEEVEVGVEAEDDVESPPGGTAVVLEAAEADDEVADDEDGAPPGG